MMKLVCEGLKPMYAELAKQLPIEDYEDEDSIAAWGALREICRMILCCNTLYERKPMPWVMMEIERNMRYVSGQMSSIEEEEHIQHEWDLISEREKELLEWSKKYKEKKSN